MISVWNFRECLIILSIDKENRFYVNEQMVSLMELRSVLQQKIKQIGVGAYLRLNAYRNLKMDRINEVMSVIRSLQIERCYLTATY